MNAFSKSWTNCVHVPYLSVCLVIAVWVFSVAHCPAGPPSIWLRANMTFRSSVFRDLLLASTYRDTAYSHSCALVRSVESPLNLKGFPTSFVSFTSAIIACLVSGLKNLYWRSVKNLDSFLGCFFCVVGWAVGCCSGCLLVSWGNPVVFLTLKKLGIVVVTAGDAGFDTTGVAGLDSLSVPCKSLNRFRSVSVSLCADCTLDISGAGVIGVTGIPSVC